MAARHEIGRVLDLTHHYAEGRAELTAALAHAGEFDDETILYDLVTSYLFERRFPDAEGVLRKLADLRTSRRGRPGTAYEDLYQIALGRNALDEAEQSAERHFEVMRRALDDAKVAPDDIQWITERAALAGRRAVVAARRQQAEKARAHLGEVEKLLAVFLAPLPPELRDPRALPAYLVVAGEVAYWLGDTPGAIKNLSSLSPRGAHITLILAQAYERQQNVPQAQALYRGIVGSPHHAPEAALSRAIAEERLAALGQTAKKDLSIPRR